MKILFIVLFSFISVSLYSQDNNGINGKWIGHYQTLRALDGELIIEIEEEGTPELKVISFNEHYPEKEQEEISSYKISDESISWKLNWGPTKVTFEGVFKGDFLVGEIHGKQEDANVEFRGYWTAVKESAQKP